MRQLTILILTLWVFASLGAQNPHGTDMKMNCASCHTSAGWEISASYWQNLKPDAPVISKTTGAVNPNIDARFHHNHTEFELKGKHATVDCRACHESLVFSEAKTKDDCVSCHIDIHQQTAGNDCARCHTPNNWLVDNIQELHQDNGFPLTGVHRTANCIECHTSASDLQFNRIGNDCISCHRSDFETAASPNHVSAGFSTNCQECHDVFTPGWSTDKVDHSFFPLTKSHDIADCAQCHTNGSYSNTPNTCVACHQAEYNGAQVPNHQSAQFSTDCASCHTTDPDWMPAIYQDHDAQHFPIYSGKHQGQWTQCTDCHTNASNYAEYSCTVCHINPETDNGHSSVNGYVYENSACLACHPTGDAGTAFDHNTTDFPLTGAHLTADCVECHAGGYAGTPTQCSACHTTDFGQATNPNHTALGLSMDCASCHTTVAGWAPATFAVHNDYYALNGAHATVANDCAACHNGNYTNTPNTCNGCHNADYAATTQPNHAAAQLPTDCATCHNETAWTPSTFDHNTVYPFVGAHVAIANDCNACHQGNYTNTPNTCNGCHNADYAATTQPNHAAAQLPTDCATCHNETAWTPSTFDHNTVYPFVGAHVAIANDCNACHQGNYTNTPNTCNGCHNADYAATTQPNHAAAQFPTDCATCHSETAWTPSTFDHNAIYPFTGAHVAIADDCNACHQGNYTNTPNTCSGCHTTDFNQTVNPNHSALGLSTDCATCHTTAPGWEPASFAIHNNYYALNGAHATIANDCATCHNGNYNNTPNTCNGCHNSDYTATTSPNHAAAQFPTDCATCHSETVWTPSTFDHNAIYPFTGAHVAIADDCNACHQGNYTNTPNTCSGCHTTDFNQTVNPNHSALGLSTDCALCHTTAPGWEPATFPVHNDYYALNGAHATIANDCATCHNGNYNNTPNTCNNCHNSDYTATTQPNHAAAQFPTDCASCHSENTWTPATFDHDGQYFPIYSGKHNGEWSACTDCHTNPANYAEFTCTTCHANPETDNQHSSVNGYVYQSNACLACHPTGDADNVFDHNTTAFPLTGAHLTTDCLDCHTAGFAGTPTQCSACHTTDFNQTMNPNHSALGISMDCATCHTTAPGWEPATFPTHNNYYVLNGAHATIANDCAACHNGNYNNTPNTCNGCHNSDYTATTSPNHAAAQFPTDCATCHSETTWTPSTFDHNAIYPFTGAHVAIADDCNACHQGNYTNTPNTCNGCHSTDFNQSLNPNHVALGIPTDCAMCHTTAPGWEPATFPIHNDYYALNGAHAAVSNDCAACHNGNYNNTPNTCNGCHNPDYTATVNPNHTAAQFSTDCATCHSETAWMPANFNHDAQYFPIYSGAHNGEWAQCTDCHNNPSDFSQVTCTTCHANPETDNQHAGVNGYTHESSACLACHPTGDANTIFDHNTTDFPLTGAHLTADCLECHAAGYAGIPTQCSACHTTDFNQTMNPNHTALGISMDCATCHTTAAGWEPATFPTHNNYYALNGAHAAISNDCAACHNGNYNNTPNTCNGCHNSDYTATTQPNHAAAQFPTDCATCHSETAWSPSTFDHNTIYPFVGAHVAIANDCAACHQGNYTNTPNTCNGCHNSDYTATTSPNHAAAQFSTECTTCHTQTAWTPATFDHNAFYPLTGAHAPIANDCDACHNGNYTNTPNTCNGCHSTDYAQSTNPNHSALGIPTDCAMCHTTAPGWEPATFPIHNNYYALNGAHAAIASDCATCHNGNYNNTPNTCNGCHNSDYTATTQPNHAAAQFPTDCATCHSETAWAPSTFDHNTIYPFVGAHIAIANDCAACHNGNYTNTPNTCNGCHNADYTATTSPNHAAAQFPTECTTCHTQTAWTPATFDHNAFYPLTGAHAPIANDCDACHNGNYTNTPNTCNGCHSTDYAQSTNPNHSALGIPTDCAMCHTTAPGWDPATFPIHNNYYALNGAHAAIASDCATCHNGNYNNTPNTCNGCHNSDYTATTQPNHVAAQFPTDCATCHSETAWAPSTFDHNTIYPFVGAHIAIANDCAACHQGNYTNTPNTCNGCHNSDYTATTSPNHAAAQFSTECTTCHTQTAWTPSTFDHNAFYPFTGAHIPIANDCNACHQGNYTTTPNTCSGCHTSDYNQATNPNHSTLAIPMDCAMCHTTAPGWDPATFPIHNNYYALNGAHAAIANDCATCHNGNYNNTPNTCNGCHNSDYTATTNPNHAAAQFPTDCASCHSETAWAPSSFNHNAFYPLNGAHATISNDCNACHNGNYTNTPNTCNGCHNSDYTATTNPNHAAAQFPTDCATCHSETAWAPATFDHNAFYPLNGAHAAIASNCNICHNGNYTNTPNTCYGCHTSDYNSATNPNHQSAQFPTTCQTCHNETAWEPSTFNHDDMYFPIYSGKHDGEWNQCSECHTTPGNYQAFSCITCHEHNNQAEVNNQHQGVSGYQYNSNACYSCHPDGSD